MIGGMSSESAASTLLGIECSWSSTFSGEERSGCLVVFSVRDLECERERVKVFFRGKSREYQTGRRVFVIRVVDPRSF